MSAFDRESFSEDIQPHVSLFTARTQEFIKGMHNSDVESSDHAADTLERAARFIIDAADLVDSIDHLVSPRLGGTDTIQNLAGEIRKVARDALAQKSSGGTVGRRQ